MKTTLYTLLKVMSFVVLLSVSQSGFSALTTVPDGLTPGAQYRLVFVTAGTHNGASTAIADYDAFVTSQANSSASLAALGTTWRVLGSTSAVDAITHTNTDPVSAGVPIYNLGGQLVASGNADLWDGSLTNAINVTQNGGALAGAVFTGTGVNGLGLFDRELGSNISTVQYGNSGLTNSGWTTIDWLGSGAGLYFYGISDVMQVVPEPATLALLAFGGLALRKRKVG